MSPGSDAVSLRTSNRNFEGRSGTASAQVYLVSPEVAALAAIKGEFVDPLSVEDVAYPQVTMPEHFDIDDSMFVFPPAVPDDIEIQRGPNIGDPPVNDPMPEKLEGSAVIKVGDKITTDHIMPAGARLKYRSNVPVYSTFVFEPVDPQFHVRAAENRDAGKHNIIVAGESYGQGSSREHAALCPMYLGVKAVVAVSIERIHMANLFNFGILPLVFEHAGDYEGIDQGDDLVIENLHEALAAAQHQGGRLMLENRTKQTRIPVIAAYSPRQLELLKAGGLLNLTKKLQEESV
jgi:aconitate hydratase